MIRTRILVVLALAVALALPPATAPAADAVKLSLNFLPYGLHAGFFVAREKGFYRDANLEVEILKGAGSNDAVQRVGSGATEYGVADFGAMSIGRARAPAPCAWARSSPSSSGASAA